MTNPIVAKIEAFWQEHQSDVFMFPNDDTFRAFFRREGYSDAAIDEALEIWWSEEYLPRSL